jgi:serine/threonine-protein kinase
MNPFRPTRKPREEPDGLLEIVSTTPNIQIERARWHGQLVLIKRLNDQARSLPEMLERFDREGEVLERLDHPNIARFMYREPGALIREFVDGRTLFYHLEKGWLERRRALRVARGLLAAIAHAHARQVIHLDLKPGNILLEPDDKVKVIDFGCAKDLTLEAITHHEARLGTPHYMAPEQFKGVRSDVRSDVYSVGAVLYETILGRPPFAPDPFAWLAGRAEPPKVWPKQPQLAVILQRALERDPNDRFQTALEMLSALEEIED